MQDNATAVEGTVIGTMVGLAVHYAALIPIVPGWLAQAVVTIAVGAISVALNRFINRLMDRRWPDRKRKRLRGDSQDTEE